MSIVIIMLLVVIMYWMYVSCNIVYYIFVHIVLYCNVLLYCFSSGKEEQLWPIARVKINQ